MTNRKYVLELAPDKYYAFISNEISWMNLMNENNPGITRESVRLQYPNAKRILKGSTLITSYGSALPELKEEYSGNVSNAVTGALGGAMYGSLLGGAVGALQGAKPNPVRTYNDGLPMRITEDNPVTVRTESMLFPFIHSDKTYNSNYEYDNGNNVAGSALVGMGSGALGGAILGGIRGVFANKRLENERKYYQKNLLEGK